MQSMTGFGAAVTKGADWVTEVKIRSVNSRFLDIKFYIPLCYSSFEADLKKLIAKKCKRGAFVVRIERAPGRPQPKLSIAYNKRQALKWKALYSRLARELKIQNPLSAENLIQKEGVIQFSQEPLRLSLQEKNQLKRACAQALTACLQERTREGLSLKKDILSHLSQLKSMTRKIDALNKKQAKLFLAKSAQKHIDKKRLAKEPSLEADRDINEEIVRVKEHLRYFEKITRDTTKAPGRKMDFYTQEILRELNTIGAKAPTAQLTRLVVEAKSLLEKIKEQAQNAE